MAFTASRVRLFIMIPKTRIGNKRHLLEDGKMALLFLKT